MRALLRTLHAWLGATCGLLLAVIGLSGALLVFKDDYLRATLPGADAPVPRDGAALGAMLERLEAGDGPVPRNVVFGTERMGLHTVDFGQGDGAYVDARGATVAAWRDGARLEQRLFELHHALFAGEPGELVAGWAALFAVAMAISGVVLWLPGRRAFAPRAWPLSGRRRDVIAQHRDLGALAGLPLLLMVLTGAGMAFQPQAERVLAVLTASTPLPRPVVRAAAGDVDWAAALAAAQARFPDARPRIAIWPTRPGEPATLRLRRAAEWHANGCTVVQLDPASGAVLATVDALALSRGERAYNALWPLHAAKLDGRLVDLLTSLTGLSLATLGSLASYTFLRSRWRQAVAARQRPVA